MNTFAMSARSILLQKGTSALCGCACLIVAQGALAQTDDSDQFIRGARANV